MKKNLLCLLFLLSGMLHAQKMITRTGVVKFDATVPGATDQVAATNNAVSALLDKNSGDLAIQVMIKSFRFKIPLMEEHFNENYMDSDKLPKATFKGKIVGFQPQNGTYDVEGDLTIHGVTQKVKTKMTLKVEGGKIHLDGTFMVKLKDYDLTVPALAKKTLAETAKLTVDLTLENKA